MLEPLETLSGELSKLPTLGARSARRLSYFLIGNRPLSTGLIKALQAVEKLKLCEICFGISEQNICHICQNDKREKNKICVLQEPQDIFAIEDSHIFKGLYHVLGGLLSPMNGISADKLRINELLQRIDSETEEVIIATNPTVEGEATAFYIKNLLKDRPIKVSRLAKGMAFGSEIDQTDYQTLQQAFNFRSEF